MSWTYTPSFLSAASSVTTSMCKIRLMVGDTDSSRQQLDDQEIIFVLTQEAVLTYAAANCADFLAAKYAFLINTENASLRLSAAARHTHYQKLADRLRANGPGDIPGGEGAGIILGQIYVGGASQADVDALRDNDDNRPGPFSVGMDDFPGTSTDDAEDT